MTCAHGVLLPVTRRRALIFAEGGLKSALGKTAHGLLRRTSRYRIIGVVDSKADRAAAPAGDGTAVPVFKSVAAAIADAPERPEIVVIGLAPTGRVGEKAILQAAIDALRQGIDVHSGLHTFIGDLGPARDAMAATGAVVVDVRRPPLRALRTYTGAAAKLPAPRILLLGQDAAVGKRTAALRLAETLSADLAVCLVGTGQTAWMQGFPHGVRLDALPMDFAAGELEAELLQASKQCKPDVFIIEGQGSLLNPAFAPETMVLLTSLAPSGYVYVTAPGRRRYADFPAFPVADATREMSLIEQISGAALLGVIVNDARGQRVPETRVPVSIGPAGDISEIAMNIREHVNDARA